MSGSRPEPEVVTISMGTGLPGFSFCQLVDIALNALTSLAFDCARFEPPEDVAS